jgi:Ca2+-binding RTX toxin-like protein
MATFNGTEGNDTLIGGADGDLINGNGGADFLQGGGGLDTIIGGTGNDTLGGNEGVDWVRGGTGNDTVAGGSGQDEFAFADFGAANADLLTDFDAGWDHIQLNTAAFTALSGSGRFSAGDARFYSAAGATAAHDADDRIIYNSTTGQLFYDADGTGAAPAELIATIQNHSALGATDLFLYNDPSQVPTPTPTPGAINGTSGNDTLVGTDGEDTINGFGGDDALRGNEGADSLNGGDGNDTLDAFNGQTSPRGVDVIDTLDGGLGNDTYLYWQGGAVVQDAGGVDQILLNIDGEYVLPTGIENLFITGASNDNVGITGNDLGNIIVASNEVDRISAGGGSDSVDGGIGRDTIDGGAGDDTLYGGTEGTINEQDFLTGGAGADHFVMARPGGEFVDQITDFVSGSDKIRLDGAFFTNIGASGNFTPADARFNYGTAAFDASDRIIFNSSTGELFYDPDGTGTQGQVLIANNLPFISATDLEVVHGTAAGSSTVGTEGNDSLVGTAADDTIDGLGGDDTIQGLDGNDSLVGGAGVDSIAGGSGNDTLIGHDGFRDRTGTITADTLDGGLGDDVYQVEAGDAILADPGGLDSVFTDTSWTLGAGLENLRIGGIDADGSSGTGNELDNRIDLSGLEHGNAVRGLGGNDMLLGAQHRTLIEGGEGNDTLIGQTSGDDTLLGGNGNDVLMSATGSSFFGNWDTLNGGAGNDTLTGTGFFTFDAAPGAANADLITNFATSDTLRLDASAFTNIGPSGYFSVNDARFFAAAGATSGHDADDRVIYNTSTGQLFYDADGSGAGAAQLFATLSSGNSFTGERIEVVNGTTPSPTPTPTPIPAGSIVGTSGNDAMNGTNGNDSIFGLAGNDTIFANGGDDWVQGGAGNDSVSGGSGQDRYAFAESGAANADQILNFGSGWDSVHLDAAGFGAIGATGRFAGGDVRFFAAAGATSGHDADDRIVYNTSTGQLFYDADGSGAGGSQLIATFQGAPGMAATDINVFGTATPSPTPTPTPGAINGTEGNDSLVGTDGNDSINGFGGNDTIDGGNGTDTMVGGAGDDLYFVDRVGADVIVEAENAGIDEVRSQANYTLPAWVNNLTLQGFANTGVGNDIENVIDGRQVEGADLWGMGGNDLLMTGMFSGIHQMHGGDGNDTLLGGDHSDNMFGDAGNDVLDGGATGGNNSMTGGSGADSFLLTSIPVPFASSNTITDFVSGLDHLRLDGRTFTQIGASGNFASGDARFYAAAGASAAHDADDRVVYDTTSGNLYYDADGTGSSSAQLIATLQGAVSLSATDIAVDNGTTPTPSPTPTPTPGQSFSGTTGNDTIVGTAGNDTIFANSGNDWIEGRGGNDQLSGGSGMDSYVFREFGAANADTLANFDGGNWDSLRFDNGAFTALGADGHFSAGDARFFAGAGASAGHDADDRIVYNTSTGQLYYDADGAGGADAQLVATIQGASPVVAADIWVI